MRGELDVWEDVEVEFEDLKCEHGRSKGCAEIRSSFRADWIEAWWEEVTRLALGASTPDHTSSVHILMQPTTAIRLAQRLLDVAVDIIIDQLESELDPFLDDEWVLPPWVRIAIMG